MHPHDAANLARSLMDEHDLRAWHFRFNRGKRTLGLCRYDRHTIELSSFFVQRNTVEAVRDTILHEIAHALAGPRAAHGPKWKRVCVQIGAKPERLDHEAAMPHGRWTAHCPSCERVYTRHRRPMKDRRYFCRLCGSEAGAIRFAIVSVPLSVTPASA